MVGVTPKMWGAASQKGIGNGEPGWGLTFGFAFCFESRLKTNPGDCMTTPLAHPRVFEAGGGEGAVKRCNRVAGKFVPDMTANDLTAKAKGGGYGCGLLVLVYGLLIRGGGKGGDHCLYYTAAGE